MNIFARTLNRRVLLINKKIQLKIAIFPITAILLTYMVVAANMYFFSKVTPLPGLDSEAVRSALMKMNYHVLADLFVLGLAMFMFSLYFSNTIAGPIYRIGNILEKISEGDPSVRIDIRKDDELQDLKDKINATIDKLRAKPQK